jgi:ribokinase
MIDACIEAAKQARASGITVVLDAGTMRKGTEALVSLADVLIASETFATPLVGTDASHETAVYALREMGPAQVVITLGVKGSIGLEDSGIVRQTAFPIRASDTTGAGDVYHGAYIYGLLQGWDMAECMRFASAAAALKCKEVGAQRGIPGLEAINNFMASS